MGLDSSTRRPIREAIDYAAHALERVGLAGKERLTPLTLSLQDKKLLELAKCLATDPRCILLDEVMAGLTMAETDKPIAVVRDLNKQGVTIVMVEHVMPVIMQLATRMVVINFGEKIAEASPTEIVKDQRVIDSRGFEEVAVGDVVLAGGEAAALVTIEACVRLLPGVLGEAASLAEESFEDGLLEHPQFTRPRTFEGLEIPEVLLSGHHGEVARWRRRQREETTRERRPDLWAAYLARHGKDS